MHKLDLIDPAHQPKTSWGGIPYSVRAGLRLSEPVHLHDDQRPLAKRLREMMKRRGISRLELAESRKGARTVKSLRLLDAAIAGKSQDTSFYRSIFQSLDVSEEAFGEIMREEEGFCRLRDEDESHRSVHTGFWIFGPHLTAMVLPEFKEYLPKFGSPYLYLCARVAYQTHEGGIDPPGPGQVALAIEQDVHWLPGVAKRYVRAYIYHRLPDEVHLISSHGDILFSGDWRYALPSEAESLLDCQQSHSCP